jgi:hypothetical protein
MKASKFKKLAAPSWQAGFRAGSIGALYVVPPNVNHTLWGDGYLIGRRVYMRLQKHRAHPTARGRA